MHLQATGILLFRYHHNEEIQTLLRNITVNKLIGTSSYSDSATGGHFWFPLSAKSQKIDESEFKIFRFNSWTTSAGFADFYVFQTPTPNVNRDHSNLTGFYALKVTILFKMKKSNLSLMYNIQFIHITLHNLYA